MKILRRLIFENIIEFFQKKVIKNKVSKKMKNSRKIVEFFGNKKLKIKRQGTIKKNGTIPEIF